MSKQRTVLLSFDLGDENVNKLRAQFPLLSFDVLEEHAQPDARRLARAEVVVGIRDAAHIPLLKNVRYIHTLSSGINRYLDGIKTLPQTVQISNSAGVFGVSVGEHALALMLASAHAVKQSVLGMQAGRWEKYPVLKDICGSTVGILGTGDIGSNVARAAAAMGARTLGYKLHKAQPQPPFDAFYYEDDGFDVLLSLSDFVVICLPGTKYTKGLIGKARFDKFKDGAILVNIGRGFIVDTDAMIDALHTGKLAFAATDVTEPEPLPPDHPLWQMENVIITPHIAWKSVRMEARTAWLAENLRAYLENRPLPGAVDIQYEY